MASMTKNLAKRLPGMTAEEKSSMLQWLVAERAVTKNPCIRSSLSERIRMLEQSISAREPDKLSWFPEESSELTEEEIEELRKP